jgi:hypothetical protein
MTRTSRRWTIQLGIFASSSRRTGTTRVGALGLRPLGHRHRRLHDPIARHLCFGRKPRSPCIYRSGIRKGRLSTQPRLSRVIGGVLEADTRLVARDLSTAT